MRLEEIKVGATFQQITNNYGDDLTKFQYIWEVIAITDSSIVFKIPTDDGSDFIYRTLQELGSGFSYQSPQILFNVLFIPYGKVILPEKKKTVLSVNLEHKSHSLLCADLGPRYSPMTSVIGNFRKYIYNLGYDVSLLNDSEILAFDDLICEAEQMNDNSYLIEVLNFLL